MRPRPLDSLSREELDWIKEDLERIGFWGYVDSQPGHVVSLGCSCRDEGFRDRACVYWDHARDGDWCIGANSFRERCHQRAVDRTPFCGFHLERALHAFASYLDVRAEVQQAHRLDFERRRRADEIAHRLELARIEDAKRVLAEHPERVYFFAADDAIKIGRSRNPEQRVKNFGTTLAPEGVNWRAGHLLGVIPGGPSLEKALHTRFLRFHLIGEWFRLTPEVGDAIAALLADQSLADTG